MDLFKKLWDWFNGNKTTIGLALSWLLAQTFFKDFLPDYTFLYQFLSWVSGLLIAGGVAHKVVKKAGE